jgi:hypothetical protein
MQLTVNAPNPNWILPDYFWSKTHTIGSAKATFIFIDTDFLMHGDEGDEEGMTKAFKGLGWSTAANTAEKQMDWIKNELQKASDSDYIFVTGHHPMGDCVAGENIKAVERILISFKVSAYFCGHFHTTQYMKIDSTQFIQVGASAFTGTKECGGDRDGTFLAGTHFGNAVLTESGFQVDLVSGDGQIVDSIKGTPRSKA